MYIIVSMYHVISIHWVSLIACQFKAETFSIMLSAFQNEKHTSPRASFLKRKIYHYKSNKKYFRLLYFNRLLFVLFFFKISYLKSKKKLIFSFHSKTDIDFRYNTEVFHFRWIKEMFLMCCTKFKNWPRKVEMTSH